MFSGRIGVTTFWKAMVLLIALYLVVGICGGILLGMIGVSALQALPSKGIAALGSNTSGILLTALPLAIMTIIGMTLGAGLLVRRLHDFGFSGVMIVPIMFLYATGLLSFVPTLTTYTPFLLMLAGCAPFAIFLISIWEGKQGANDYGERLLYPSWFAALIGSRTGAKMEIPSIAEEGKAIIFEEELDLSSALFPRNYTVPTRRAASPNFQQPG